MDTDNYSNNLVCDQSKFFYILLAFIVQFEFLSNRRVTYNNELTFVKSRVYAEVCRGRLPNLDSRTNQENFVLKSLVSHRQGRD